MGLFGNNNKRRTTLARNNNNNNGGSGMTNNTSNNTRWVKPVPKSFFSSFFTKSTTTFTNHRNKSSSLLVRLSNNSNMILIVMAIVIIVLGYQLDNNDTTNNDITIVTTNTASTTISNNSKGNSIIDTNTGTRGSSSSNNKKIDDNNAKNDITKSSSGQIQKTNIVFVNIPNVLQVDIATLEPTKIRNLPLSTIDKNKMVWKPKQCDYKNVPKQNFATDSITPYTKSDKADGNMFFFTVLRHPYNRMMQLYHNVCTDNNNNKKNNILQTIFVMNTHKTAQDCINDTKQMNTLINSLLTQMKKKGSDFHSTTNCEVIPQSQYLKDGVNKYFCSLEEFRTFRKKMDWDTPSLEKFEYKKFDHKLMSTANKYLIKEVYAADIELCPKPWKDV